MDLLLARKILAPKLGTMGLAEAGGRDYDLVKLTRSSFLTMTETPSQIAEPRGPWKLQDAKARFSELVRLAGEAGPQHVTVNGKEKAVVLSAKDYRRLRGEPMGDALIRLLAEVDLDEVEFEHAKSLGPVRHIEL
jgi:prevent-host-death family protein